MTLMPYPYVSVFRATEESLLKYGSRNVNLAQIHAALDQYKVFAHRVLTDEVCFSILVDVVFYSGFRAATVTEKLPVIKRHFPAIDIVADYGHQDIDRILADKEMIRHEGKIKACVKNAQAIKQLIQKHGSFSLYLASFKPTESEKNLQALKRDLQRQFSYISKVTSYHLLTDFGFDVLKPDLVICRIFKRLGIINDEGDLLEVIRQGRMFAEATKLPIRYIDIVFVAYGQVQSNEMGVDRGICLKVPRCGFCGLTVFCEWYKNIHAH